MLSPRNASTGATGGLGTEFVRQIRDGMDITAADSPKKLAKFVP